MNQNTIINSMVNNANFPDGTTKTPHLLTAEKGANSIYTDYKSIISIPDSEEKVKPLEEKILLHIDNKRYQEKPKVEEIAVIKPRLQNKRPCISVTLEQLAEKIEAGFSISPAIMKNGTKAENWQQQQLFLVDIDNDKDEILAKKLKTSVENLDYSKRTPILTVEEALDICRENNIPLAFYYYSFNHTEQKPKYRLAFILDEVITNTNIRSAIIQSLLSLFRQADPSCKNADRFFFGTNKEVVLCDIKSRVSVETVLSAYTPSIVEKSEVKDAQSKIPSNTDLEKLKTDFDFFEYLKKQNGELKYNNENFAMFQNCRVCEHQNCLVYYKKSNTFYCFGAAGQKGGSVIDYIMATDKVNLSTAIKKFKQELCEITEPPMKEFWEEPIPFDSVSLPKFPINCLPTVISDYVNAVAASTQTSPDMAASAALSMIALSVQDKIAIRGKLDWIEPLNLYMAVIAQSSERKSVVLKFMSKPIVNFERNENERRAPLIEQANNEKSFLNKKKQFLEKELAKGSKNAKEADLKDVLESLKKIKEVKPLTLFCDDITQEKLAGIMLENNNSTSIMTAEGGIFDILSGQRYSQCINIDIFLKSFFGEEIKIHRIGRPSEYIEKPALTILTFVQPVVIETLMSNYVIKQRGFCDRFLYSIPTSTVGSRDLRKENPIPQIVADRYSALIESLLTLDPKDNDIKLLTLEKKAFEKFCDFSNTIEQMSIDKELSYIRGFLGKFVGIVLRIAGILHIMESNMGKEVSEITMINAIEIGKYYLEHSKLAYQLSNLNSITSDVKYVWDKIKSYNEISFRDIQSMVHSRLNKKSNLSPIMQHLIDMGYIQEKCIMGQNSRTKKIYTIYQEKNDSMTK